MSPEMQRQMFARSNTGCDVFDHVEIGVTLGRAQGVLMAVRQCSAADALSAMNRCALRNKVPLVVAILVTATFDLPAEPAAADSP